MGTKPSHHPSPGGERHGKKKCWKIFLEKTREGHCQSDEHWHHFKGDVVSVSKLLEQTDNGDYNSSVFSVFFVA